ncbi:MAG: phospholipase D-like domain-containing protein [Bacteriovoracaceae bacterium]
MESLVESYEHHNVTAFETTNSFSSSTSQTKAYAYWKSENLFFNNDLYFESLLLEIETAKRSVLIEAHIYDSKVLGKRFTKSILKTLSRGVKVFLLLDGAGGSTYPKSHFRLLERNGAEICLFHPLPWQKSGHRNVHNVNCRLHKKLWIIDRKIAYSGSLNIDSRHLSQDLGGEDWKDVGIRVSGKRVGLLENSFWQDWSFAKFGRETQENDHIFLEKNIRLNHSTLLRNFNSQSLLRQVLKAKKRIDLVNPYFVPDKKFLLALKKAIRRGVKVRVIVPKKSDLKWFPLVNSLNYGNLIKDGIKVFQYNPSILHAKICLIDNWAMVGSSNLNSRSFYHDIEMDLVLTSRTNLEIINDYFLKLLSHSQSVRHFEVLKKLRNSSGIVPLFKAIRYWL